jgi:hypothetical protein
LIRSSATTITPRQVRSRLEKRFGLAASALGSNEMKAKIAELMKVSGVTNAAMAIPVAKKKKKTKKTKKKVAKAEAVAQTSI